MPYTFTLCWYFLYGYVYPSTLNTSFCLYCNQEEETSVKQRQRCGRYFSQRCFCTTRW